MAINFSFCKPGSCLHAPGLTGALHPSGLLCTAVADFYRPNKLPFPLLLQMVFTRTCPSTGLSPVPLLAPARQPAGGEDELAFNSSNSLPLQEPQLEARFLQLFVLAIIHGLLVYEFMICLLSLLQFHCFMDFPLSLCISASDHLFLSSSILPLQYSSKGELISFSFQTVVSPGLLVFLPSPMFLLLAMAVTSGPKGHRHS